MSASAYIIICFAVYIFRIIILFFAREVIGRNNSD